VIAARISYAADRASVLASHFAGAFGADTRTAVELRDIVDELRECARLVRREPPPAPPALHDPDDLGVSP